MINPRLVRNMRRNRTRRERAATTKLNYDSASAHGLTGEDFTNYALHRFDVALSRSEAFKAALKDTQSRKPGGVPVYNANDGLQTLQNAYPNHFKSVAPDRPSLMSTVRDAVRTFFCLK